MAFECAGGSPEQGLAGAKTLEQAIKIVRNGGKIIQEAHLSSDVTLPANTVVSRNINYMGTRHCTHKLVDYVTYLVASGRVQLKPMITHVLEGIEKVPESFEITGKKGEYGAINPAQVIIAR